MDLTRHTTVRPTVVQDGDTLRIATTDLLSARSAGKTNVARRQHAAIVAGLRDLTPQRRTLTYGTTLGQLERLGAEGISIAEHVLDAVRSTDQQEAVTYWTSLRDGLIDSARDLSWAAATAA